MTEAPDRVFTTGEVCRRFHIDARTLRRRLEENPHIKPMRPGRSLVFTSEDVRLLEEAFRRRAARSVAALGEALGRPAEAPRSVDDALRSLRRRETQRLLKPLREAWTRKG